jgi:hypothetical protein
MLTVILRVSIEILRVYVKGQFGFSYKTEQFFYHNAIGSPKIRCVEFWSPSQSEAALRSAKLESSAAGDNF